MIDERMIADAVKRFRQIVSLETKMDEVENNCTLFFDNIDKTDGCLQDAAFYAKLLSQEYKVLAREIEAMCSDTTENVPPTKDGDQ